MCQLYLKRTTINLDKIKNKIDCPFIGLFQLLLDDVIARLHKNKITQFKKIYIKTNKVKKKRMLFNDTGQYIVCVLLVTLFVSI